MKPHELTTMTIPDTIDGALRTIAISTLATPGGSVQYIVGEPVPG